MDVSFAFDILSLEKQIWHTCDHQTMCLAYAAIRPVMDWSTLRRQQSPLAMRKIVRRSDMESRKTLSETPDYAVILWDNDGVLVDTERLCFQATREIYARVEIDLTAELFFEYFLMRSEGTSQLASAHGLSEAGIAELRSARDERYQQLLEQEQITIDVYADAGDAAAALRYGNRDKLPSSAFRDDPPPDESARVFRLRDHAGGLCRSQTSARSVSLRHRPQWASR